MNSNLLSKFIIVYIIIGVIGFIGISFICYSVDYKSVTDSTEKALYNQAVSISQEYASRYFSEENLRSIETQLETISALSGTHIMFIDTQGDIILDTLYHENREEPYHLDNFDFTLSGSKYSQTGTFYGYFNETMLTVLASISSSFTTKGYTAVHIPMSQISDQVALTFNTNYISFFIIFGLSFVFILLYLMQIHKPLTEIIKGADEYGKGNLNHKIKALNNDEIGHLGDSLNYMAEKLNDMDQYQQKFLSNISHDFRSPLTSIKGYLEAVTDGTIPPDQLNKYINIILFETERLTKLTSNILTLNELDPKSLKLDLVSFDINNIIKHTIESFEGACKEKSIRFDLTFSSRSLYVLADVGKIQQVLYNLIDNAIKFSSHHSAIFISINEKGEKVFVSIKDTGIGISKENIDKIWNRFYKSDASRGKDKKGSGLGLAIAKDIILLHQENIDVISTEKVGTEFIFTLTKAKS